MANIINGKEQAKYIIEKIKSHTEKYLENNNGVVSFPSALQPPFTNI